MCNVFYSKLKKIELCLYFNVKHFEDITQEQLEYHKIYVDENYKSKKQRAKDNYELKWGKTKKKKKGGYKAKNKKELKRHKKIIKWFHLTGEFKDFK